MPKHMISGSTAPSLPSSLDPIETNVESPVLMRHPFPAIHRTFQSQRNHLINALSNGGCPKATHRARKINQCCAFPSIRTNSEGNPSVSLMRCRDRLCPLCSRFTARRTSARVEHVIGEWDQCRHLTLTLESSEEPLGKQIDLLLASFRRLRQRGFWKKVVRGGIGTMEITYNRSTDRWHPHLHVLLDGRYVSHSIISDEWSKVTGGSFIVYIQATHSKRDAARYIAKYVSKPSEMENLPPSRTVELALALSGRRTMITFGTAHNVGLPVREREVGSAGSKHVLSVHHVIRAFAAKKSYAIELVRLAKEHMPLLARLVVGDRIDDLPPPSGGGDNPIGSMNQLLDDIRCWCDSGIDPVRTLSIPSAGKMMQRSLFRMKPVGMM